MAKFPSQRKILYQTGNISDDNFVQLASGGVSGDLNLPKDLSLLNRRGYASTTRKGVPLIYKCKVDFYVHDELGNSPHTHADGSKNTLGSDAQVILKLAGCQNNWVMRNAAVKFHAAYHESLRKAGVKKGHLGAYANEIRYNYDSNGDTWMVPIDGDGSAFTGGTWDDTDLFTESDSSGFKLKLVGQGLDETSANTATAINIGHSYLASRAHVAADSNLESSEAPAKFSVLNELLRPVATSAQDDNIIAEAQGSGDNPPYEIDIDNADSDITEPVELGRAIAGLGHEYGSMIVEIPFGLGEFTARVSQTASIDDLQALICVEVLDIYEMTG